jgi:hypothetical protein
VANDKEKQVFECQKWLVGAQCRRIPEDQEHISKQISFIYKQKQRLLAANDNVVDRDVDKLDEETNKTHY